MDPLPTHLLEQCLDEPVPVITCIVNKWLESASVPASLKHATVRPLLKKPGLDTNEFNNFRPISNLKFLSKIIEKIVAARLDHHMDLHQLHDPLQSAYKANHSTETALLKVQSAILDSIDTQHVVVQVQQDLPAAFDTVDHKMLFDRLSSDCVVGEKALDWFKSYLTE